MVSDQLAWETVPAPHVDLGTFDNAVALILDLARNHDKMIAQIRVRAVLEDLMSGFEEAAAMHFRTCSRRAEQRRAATGKMRQRRDALLQEERAVKDAVENERRRHSEERDLDAKEREVEARERRLFESELQLEKARKRLDEREAVLRRGSVQAPGANKGEIAREADTSWTLQPVAAADTNGRSGTTPLTPSASAPPRNCGLAHAADAAERLQQPAKPDEELPQGQDLRLGGE